VITSIRCRIIYYIILYPPPHFVIVVGFGLIGEINREGKKASAAKTVAATAGNAARRAWT
jgi:hypothetical protein